MLSQTGMQRRIARGRGIVEQGRRCQLERRDNVVWFQMQTTEQFKAGEWPVGVHDSYGGWIRLGDEGHVIEAMCTCPDSRSRGCVVKGARLYCKHVWAVKALAQRIPASPVELFVKKGGLLRRQHLAKVRVGGKEHQPKHDLDHAQAWLEDHLFDEVDRTENGSVMKIVYKERQYVRKDRIGG